MKQKDILLVVVVVIISGTISWVISRWLFSVPTNRQTRVEVVQPISSTFPEADKRYLNPNAVDPTKNITIGDNQNSQPFNSQNGQ